MPSGFKPLLGCVLVWVGCSAPLEPVRTGGGGGESGSGGGGGGGSFTGGCFGAAGGVGGSGPDVADPVVVPARAPPPISGGTLAVMGDGTLVAADPDRDRLWIAAPPQSAAREVVLSEGDEPGRVVEGPAGRAFVALRGAGVVAEVDVANAQVVARHPACAAPRGLGWSAPKQQLTVACATGALVRLKFDANSSAPARTVQHLATDLRDVVVRPNDVLVSTFRSAEVFAVADDGTAIPLLGQVSEDVARHVAWRMVPTPGGALLVHQLETTRPLTASSCTGYYTSSPVQTGLTTIGGIPYDPPPRSATLPVDLAVSPAGDWAMVAAGERQVLRFHYADGVVAPFSPGGEPVAVAFRGEDLILFSREPAALLVQSAATGELTAITLPAASVFSTAHELFHRATPSHIACASCHPEGGDDGHVWNLPEGPRRTNLLRGGLKATAPYHWQGDRADIIELLADVMVQRMAGPMPSDAQAAALLDWLDALPAPPLPEDLDAAAVGRGKVLFESPQQACTTCHSGPLGTNNATMNVGTDGPFQVPRLVGLAARAPYFHDGRIANLADRFLPGAGGEAHGHPGALTDGERADLVEYLRSR